MTDRINLNAPFQSFRLLLPSRPSHLLKETNQLDLISRNKHATTWESEEGTAREGESVHDVHFIFGFGHIVRKIYLCSVCLSTDLGYFLPPAARTSHLEAPFKAGDRSTPHGR